MNVMLLAAGEGTRLRPYTLKKPKPAIPFLNMPLAAHALRFLGSTQIDKLVVNTFHLPAEVRQLFSGLPHGAQELVFSDEVDEILGNGGGLGKAHKHFYGGGDFILMNSDEVILPSDSEIVHKAIEHHKKTGALATLLVMEHPGVGSQFGGAWANTENNIRAFGKQGLEPGDKGWHFVGIQILSEKIFDYIPAKGASNILYDVVTAAMADGHLAQVFPISCRWFETGNPTDFFLATQQCLDILSSSNETPEKSTLEAGFIKYLKSGNQVLTRAQGRILTLNPGVIPESLAATGFVCVSQGALIGDDCSLENVIIGPGVQVPDNSKLSHTILL